MDNNNKTKIILEWVKFTWPFILTLIMQTAIIAYGYGTLTNKVDELKIQNTELKQQITDLKNQNYKEIKDDFALRDKRIDVIEKKLDDHIKDHLKE